MPKCTNTHLFIYVFFFNHKSNVYRCIPGRNRECMTLSYAESGQWCIQGHPAYSERQGLSPVLGGGFSQHLFSDPFIWRCLGQKLGLPACKTDTLPLKYGFLPARGSLKETGAAQKHRQELLPLISIKLSQKNFLMLVGEKCFWGKRKEWMLESGAIFATLFWE